MDTTWTTGSTPSKNSTPPPDGEVEEVWEDLWCFKLHVSRLKLLPNKKRVT